VVRCTDRFFPAKPARREAALAAKPRPPAEAGITAIDIYEYFRIITAQDPR
jgi:hypothetical protein